MKLLEYDRCEYHVTLIKNVLVIQLLRQKSSQTHNDNYSFSFQFAWRYTTSKIVEPFPTRIKTQLVNFLSQQYISGNNFSYPTISHFYNNVQILEYFEINTVLYLVISILRINLIGLSSWSSYLSQEIMKALVCLSSWLLQ